LSAHESHSDRRCIAGRPWVYSPVQEDRSWTRMNRVWSNSCTEKRPRPAGSKRTRNALWLRRCSGKRENGNGRKRNAAALVESSNRAALERHGQKPLRPTEQPNGIHYTKLPEAELGDVLGAEWKTYRREVGRLLSEGQGGRFVLIKDETILGLYDTWDAAREVGLQRFLMQPFLVHEIRAEEPYLRIRGVNLPGTNSRFR
jgi:hypothetical protein